MVEFVSNYCEETFIHQHYTFWIRSLYSKIVFWKSPLRYLPCNPIFYSDLKFTCHSENSSNTLNSSWLLLIASLSGQVLLSSLPFEQSMWPGHHWGTSMCCSAGRYQLVLPVLHTISRYAGFVWCHCWGNKAEKTAGAQACTRAATQLRARTVRVCICSLYMQSDIMFASKVHVPLLLQPC